MEDFNVTLGILALAILVGAFLIGSVTDLHMGIAAISAAAIAGPLVYGESMKTVQSGFPLDLFFTLLGVTYLFAIANNNGTVSWIVALGLRAVAGRASLFPFVMFFITALLTAIGCATPAAAAILMPIALGFNRLNNVNPLPMAQSVIQGATAGSLSPMGVYGIIAISTLRKSSPELADSYGILVAWALAIVVCLAIVVAHFLLYRKAGPSEAEAAGIVSEMDTEGVEGALVDEEFGDFSAAAASQEEAAKVTLNPERTLTVIGIGVMALLIVISTVARNNPDMRASVLSWFPAFGIFNVGLTALAIGAILTLIYPKGAKGAVMQIAWPTILLVGGIVTYVSLLERNGVIQWLGDLAAGLGNPRISSIIILFIGALVSAYASTTGILGALVPLSVPFLTTADGSPAALSTTMLVGALIISSATVDCSPFSTNGALGVANAAHQADYVYKGLFLWSWILIVGTPIVTWALMIAPPWGAGS